LILHRIYLPHFCNAAVVDLPDPFFAYPVPPANTVKRATMYAHIYYAPFFARQAGAFAQHGFYRITYRLGIVGGYLNIIDVAMLVLRDIIAFISFAISRSIFPAILPIQMPSDVPAY
jgi:hypothetical protein